MDDLKRSKITELFHQLFSQKESSKESSKERRQVENNEHQTQIMSACRRALSVLGAHSRDMLVSASSQEAHGSSTVRHPWDGGQRRVLTLLQHAVRSFNYFRADRGSIMNLSKLCGFFSNFECEWSKRERLMLLVSPRLRYRLLRCSLQSSAAHKLEIGTIEGHRSMPLKGLTVPITIFTSLKATDALTFFERLLREMPNASFLSSDSQHASPPILQQNRNLNSGSGTDHQLLRAHLIKSTSPDSLNFSKEHQAVIDHLPMAEVERRKVSAKNGKEPYVRTSWALSALRLCAGLRDCTLLNETLVWTRRFKRDVLVVKGIYPRLDITPFLALGVMTPKEKIHATQDQLKHRVEAGNMFVMRLLETVMTIQNQKSFAKKQLWDNKAVRLASSGAITLSRRVKELQSALELTDSTTFVVLLRPTLDLLVHAETVLLDYETGNSRGQAGLIVNGSDQIGYSQKAASPVDIQFWDHTSQQDQGR